MEIKRTFTNLIHDVLHQQYLIMLVIQHGIKNDRLCHEEYLLRPLAWFCSQKASMYACCMVNDSVGWARDPETTLNLNPMLVNHLTMIWTLEVGQCSPLDHPQGIPCAGTSFLLPAGLFTQKRSDPVKPWGPQPLMRRFEVVRTKTQADT